ncbi:MAG: hypothetical protein K9G57_14845 [Ignavibacteriales bacterium]|nr:hypothetical protein [Ignavibacteriales bacterium]MCF8438127.1 hypothetical protein [Ignavibacteriales bacterium]
MMKKIYFLTVCLFFAASFNAQEKSIAITGEISLVTRSTIYVKFSETKGFEIGDTLYYSRGTDLIPVVKVKFKSSTSLAGEPITEAEFKKGDSLTGFARFTGEFADSTDDSKDMIEPVIAVLPDKSKEFIKESSDFRGKFSVTSYTNFNNYSSRADNQRWRYRLSLDSKDVAGLPIDLQTYITFNYRTRDWQRVKSNLGEALKIYDLALIYKISESSRLTVGRKINPKLSNAGAIDGFQYENNTKYFEYGVIAGSRPNFSDYGVIVKLFQAGAYISRQDSVFEGIMNNSFSIINQTNNLNTDRRFLYFQHSSLPLSRLNLFFSSEIDLYKKFRGISETTFNITSIYLSAGYSFNRWLSMNASYDARKNVIYYETFRTLADSIYDNETRQGFRARLNLRPFNNLFLGISYGTRAKKSDIRSSDNYGFYASYSRVPLINASLSFSTNFLRTNYIDGNIAGFQIRKELLNNLLDCGIGYRIVKYHFIRSATDLKQNILEADLGVNFLRKFYLTLNYEGTFEQNTTLGRIFINFNWKF